MSVKMTIPENKRNLSKKTTLLALTYIDGNGMHHT